MKLPLFFRSLSFTTVILVLVCLVVDSYAAVLAIDYGTEWTKAALVKPGIPLQIVLTKDTKRKEQSVVAFKKQERLYGGDAFNLGARFPEATYPSLKSLLGRMVDSDVVERYLEQHPAIKTVASNRSTLAFGHGENTYSVEELVAMQIVNIKGQAEQMAEEKIKELVLTVPAFWTEQERKAIIDAAELAGMRVSTLIHDVAIHYATTRTFTEEPQYHLIYDMGAGSTTATVVSFSSRTVKEGRSNKTVIDISTHGTGYDRALGGDLFNARLVDNLAEAFRSSKAGAKAKTDIKTDGRAFARLFKEASRVKHVLSANADTSASIESLHEDIDFRTKVSRATFEEVTSDLVDRVTTPIQIALKDANLTLDQLESVVLHGGSVRVPFVQKALEDVVGSEKIAKTVNADEAGVMGAIFRGAQLNNQFRVKDIRPKDYSTYGIHIVSNATLDSSKDTPISVFPRKTKLGNTKILSFKTSEDVAFKVSYDDGGDFPEDISKSILDAKITGVAEKIEKLKGVHECHDPTVKVSLKLTDAGLVEVLHSEVVCEIREKKNFADKFKGLFGGGKDKEEKEEQDVFELPKAETSTTSSADATSTPIDKADKVRYEKTALRVSVVNKSPAYLTPEQKLDSKKLLVSLDRLDQNRAAREEALNSLEAYIYKSRDFLEDSVFQKVSSKDERKSLKETIEAASEWLFSSDAATFEDFKSRLTELTTIEEPISKRKADLLARPQRIETLNQILNSTKEFVKTSRELLAAPLPKPKNSEDDLDETATESEAPISMGFQFEEKAVSSLESLVSEVETWLSEKIAAQEKLKLWEEPVLLLTDIEKKGTQLQNAFRKMLMEQAKPKTKPKKSSTSTSSASRTTAASGTTSMSSASSDTTSAERVETGKPVYTEVEEDLEETVTTTVTSMIIEEAASSTGEIRHEEL